MTCDDDYHNHSQHNRRDVSRCCSKTYPCLILSFLVILVSGALAFIALERDVEVATRIQLAELKRSFAEQYNIDGDVFVAVTKNNVIYLILNCSLFLKLQNQSWTTFWRR